MMSLTSVLSQWMSAECLLACPPCSCRLLVCVPSTVCQHLYIALETTAKTLKHILSRCAAVSSVSAVSSGGEGTSSREAGSWI